MLHKIIQVVDNMAHRHGKYFHRDVFDEEAYKGLLRRIDSPKAGREPPKEIQPNIQPIVINHSHGHRR
jgi:hypothetical protein